MKMWSGWKLFEQKSLTRYPSTHCSFGFITAVGGGFCGLVFFSERWWKKPCKSEMIQHHLRISRLERCCHHRKSIRAVPLRASPQAPASLRGWGGVFPCPMARQGPRIPERCREGGGGGTRPGAAISPTGCGRGAGAAAFLFSNGHRALFSFLFTFPK